MSARVAFRPTPSPIICRGKCASEWPRLQRSSPGPHAALRNREEARMSPEQIRLLYEYNRWATRRALDACTSLTEEQFTRDLHSSFRSVRDTLLHIIAGEWFWLERFRGRSPSALPPFEPLPHPAAVSEHWATVERELLEFATTRPAEDLG